jgi:hypothetical protein
MSYEPEDFDQQMYNQLAADLGAGCGGYTGDSSLQVGVDYSNIAPGAKQSWNYLYHNIPQAWGVSTGAGIKIMVIDTGVSPDQNNMNSLFNQGYYTNAGNDTSVRIISLSIGRLTGSSQIKDAINYAYSKGKLMFCAAGTSTDFTSKFVGVIFPASLPNVEAITGVKNSTTLVACDDCHKGSQVDFVVVMERTSDKGVPICNAMSGNVPTTVGGSSVATSSSSGVAALVWSAHPTETRDQILNRLTTTASSYPNKTKSFGYGKLNAYAAITQ